MEGIVLRQCLAAQLMVACCVAYVDSRPHGPRSQPPGQEDRDTVC